MHNRHTETDYEVNVISSTTTTELNNNNKVFPHVKFLSPQGDTLGIPLFIFNGAIRKTLRERCSAVGPCSPEH